VDSSLESQCFQFLVAAGTHGITQRDAAFALNIDETRTIYKLLDRMADIKGTGADRYGAVRQLEFEGRMKRFRYYTFAAYKKIEGVDVVPAPLPESQFDDSQLYENDYFVKAPHNLRDLNRHIKAAIAAGQSRNTLSVVCLHPKRKGGTIGRPTKAKAKPDTPTLDTPTSDTPKKRGRPKGTGSPRNAKKSKKDSEVSVSESNQTNTSTAPESNITEGVATPSQSTASAMDIVQPPVSSANTALSAEIAPESSTSAATIEKHTQATLEPTIVIPKPPLPCSITVSENHSELTPKPLLPCPAIISERRSESKVSMLSKKISELPSKHTETSELPSSHTKAPELPSKHTKTSELPSSHTKTSELSSSQAKAQTLLNLTGSLVSHTKTSEKSSLRTFEADARATRSTKTVSVAKAKEKNKPVPQNADKIPPSNVATGNRSLRKRTIADYFGKINDTRAAASIFKEPALELESAVASPNYVPETSLNDTISTATTSSQELENTVQAEPLKSTCNEPISIDVDSEEGMTSMFIDLVDMDETSAASLSSFTTLNEPEPLAVTESIKESAPSLTNIAIPIESANEPSPSLSSIAISDEANHIDTAELVTESTLVNTAPQHVSAEAASIETGLKGQFEHVAENSIPQAVSIETALIEPTLVEETPTLMKESEQTTEDITPQSSISTEPMTVETDAIAKQSTSVQLGSFLKPKSQATTFSNAITHYPHKKKQLNIYLETRIKVLLALLADSPIFELGKNLSEAYEQKAIEMQYNTKSAICNKTLWRTAQVLAERDLAKVDTVEFPMLSGKITTRKLLIRKDIDLKGDQYTAYIRHMTDRKTVHAVHLKIKDVETTVSPVERLDDRLIRMREEVQLLYNQGEQTKALELEKRIEELNANLNKFGQERSNKQKTRYWMIKALQYGFINARMIRFKLLHNYFFEILNRGAPGTSPEDRTVSVKGMINNMPLSVLCQAVGLNNPDEYTLDYMRDPSNGSIIFSDAPLRIKQGIFSSDNKILIRLRTALRVMIYLDILSPVCTDPSETIQDKYSNKIFSYKLNDKIAIKISRKRGQPILRVCEIKDATDLAYYWSELEYACTNPELNKLSADEKEPLPEDPVEQEYFTCINSARNWSNNTVLTRSQRKILNSYVDKENRTTPLDDLATLRLIVDITALPLPVVRRYYEKVHSVMNRRLEVQEMKRLRRNLAPYKRRSRIPSEERDQGRRIISLKSKRAFRPREYKTRVFGTSEVAPDAEVQRQRTIDEKHTKGEMLYMDNMEDLPVLPNDSVNILRLSRTRRTVWTAQDDELLIYVYIILRHRSRSKFYWAAAAQVFPDRSLGSLRHRLPKLLNSTTYAERYDMSTPLWDKYYHEGILSGELEDTRPTENIYFDLLGFVSYFIRKMAENNPR
jgi:hypothetical protein